MAAHVLITNLDSDVQAFLDAYGVQLTRRINGYCEMKFLAATDDPNARELLIGKRAAQLLRDGEIRFMGRLGGPFVDGANWVACNAYDPFFFLKDRHVGDENLAPLVYTDEDAGAIAVDLITDDIVEAGQSNCWIGSIESSVDRDRTYEPGKSIAEAIEQLAEVDDGFFFRMDALGEGAKFATFNVMYPDAGDFKPQARFEFGPGTLNNIDEESLEVERFDVVNRVIAVGAGEGESRPAVEVLHAASRIEYGTYERWLDFSDVTDEATLTEHAQEIINPHPRITIRFDALEGAPALFDDFDVGDTVPVFIDNGRTTVFDKALRVNEVTLEIDDDTGAERLTGVVLESTAHDIQEIR